MRVSRRSFVGAALSAGACAFHRGSDATGRRPAGLLQSVTGGVSADRLGVTLMHEHVLVDFIAADLVSPSRYEPDRVVATVLPHLRQVRELGCETLVDCTPAYLGRDPALLKRLSEASGLRILTNTGYYGAANDRHLPRHAFTETAEQLASRWIREFEHGLDKTSIKPAFMKIGVDEAPLSEVDAKLVRAAAITHRETRLAIASHTSSGRAAMEELDLLDQAGVPASAFIWVHAHNERDTAFHIRAAQRGAWIEFDGVAPATVQRHVDLVRGMKTEGLLSRALVSHDAGWYRVGEPGGGTFRPYDTVFTVLAPALASAGLSAAEIRQLLAVNPGMALGGSQVS